MPPPSAATGAMAPPAQQAGGAGLPVEPVERTCSLAELLFEFLDEKDTDAMLLAELNRTSKQASQALSVSQQRTQGAAQQSQPQLLQQMQQRRLLERAQLAKQQQQGEMDLFALRDPSNATSSSHMASGVLGSSVSPWPSFTSTAGQPGPGAAVLFGSSNADVPCTAGGTTPAAAAAAAATDAGSSLAKQLQVNGSLPNSLPALKAAAGVAEGALLERQAMKRQVMQQMQQQQQQGEDTPMPNAPSVQQQQQQEPVQQPQTAGGAETAAAPAAASCLPGQQQQQGAPAAASAAAGLADAAPAAAGGGGSSAAAAGVDTTGAAGDAAGASTAATAAALLAEAGDDFNLDLDFLESMLHDGGGDIKMLGDLARMVSLPAQDSPVALLQQQQQQLMMMQQLNGSSAGANLQQQQQQQQAGAFNTLCGGQHALNGSTLPAGGAAAGIGMDASGGTAFAAAAATGPLILGSSAVMQAEAAPSMDSGMRSALNHLNRLQIPSPSGDLGLASVQGPMSVDVARSSLDQGAPRGNMLGAGYVPNPGGSLQALQQGLLGPAGASNSKPPLPAGSCKSGVSPCLSVPHEESNGSVGEGAAEAMSDGEVEQAATGRRTSARRRSKQALAKHKRQQQQEEKAQQQQAEAAAAAPAAAAAAVSSGLQDAFNSDTPAAAQPCSQPQIAPGGMLSLLLNGSSNISSMALAAASPAPMQMDLQQQQQQMLLQSYGSAPNPVGGMGLESALSPLLGSAASTGQLGSAMAMAAGGFDPLLALPKEQITAVLAGLKPSALTQLLELQKRQPILARVVLKRALLQMQSSSQQQPQQLPALSQPQLQLPDVNVDAGAAAAAAAAVAATPTAATSAPTGMPKARQQTPKAADAAAGQNARRNKPLVFYRQRSSRSIAALGKPSASQQQQRAGSAGLPEIKQEAMSPQPPGSAGVDAAALQQMDPAMAAALCAPTPTAGGGQGAASADQAAGHPGSFSGSDHASSDGQPPNQQQQPSSNSRRLGKRVRQNTVNDLSGAVAAAAAATAAAGGTGSQGIDPPGSGPAPQSSGQLPMLSMQNALQMQLQSGLAEAGQFGYREAAAGAAENPAAAGLAAALFGQHGSAVTGSSGSAGGAPDAAVITQQARALVRILTKLNSQQLAQTRMMLHSVLQRSAPGLLDHMGAIERMINQLIMLKHSQPSLPQQQQQALVMQGAFGQGGDMFGGSATGTPGAGANSMCTMGTEAGPLMQATQQQQQLQGMQGMLQRQHMMNWPNDPFVQHQLQQQPQQQMLQSQMQQQQQQQQPWGIASSLSGPQPLPWGAQPTMQPGDITTAAGNGVTAVGGVQEDVDQTPYQLATRRQQGRRCKPKPDEQQLLMQQQQAATSGLQMAASAPAGLVCQQQPAAAAMGNAVGLGMNQQQSLQMPQQQQQFGTMDMQQQQQQRMQQLQQQQQRMQQLQMQQQLLQQQQQQLGVGLASNQLMQQQQLLAQQQHSRDPLPAAAAGDAVWMDAASERQQEDLLNWLQIDSNGENWDGPEMLGS